MASEERREWKAVHWLDRAYAEYGAALALTPRRRLFASGFGDEAFLGDLPRHLRFSGDPMSIAIGWGSLREGERGLSYRDGTFVSPAGGLSGVAKLAHLRHWTSREGGGFAGREAFVVMAGSREEGYALREDVWKPLARRFEVLILENPLYGLRRPAHQRTSSVETVSEHLRMNAASVEEARSILEWLVHNGARTVGVAGFSMGGYMAALVAATTRFPVAVASIAGGASSRPVFCKGCLAGSIDFAALGGDEGSAWARKRVGDFFDVAAATNYTPPVRPEAARLLGFTRDGFVPNDETRALQAHWRGSRIAFADAGHISALFTERRRIRAAMSEAFDVLA